MDDWKYKSAGDFGLPMRERLLSTRRHTYPDYTRSSFEAGFSRHFEILEHRTITDSKRVLYLMRAH